MQTASPPKLATNFCEDSFSLAAQHSRPTGNYTDWPLNRTDFGKYPLPSAFCDSVPYPARYRAALMRSVY